MSTLEPDVVEALVEAAHAQGLRTYAHIVAHGKAIAAIEAGLDGLVHLTAAPSRPGDLGQGELERLVEIMEAEGVAASTTLTVFDDFVQISAAQGDEQTSQMIAGLLAGMQKTLSRIAEANANLLALGTDSPHLDPADAYHREIELVSQAGLTPGQVIQAATRNAGMHMGLGSELGTLEAGKLADFLIVAGDPTSDLSALREVILVAIGGEIVYERE